MIVQGHFHALHDPRGHVELMQQLMEINAVCGALLLGTVYGVLVAFAPDHLGTIITLTVATDDATAFRVGSIWGFTHAAGMGLVILGLFVFEWMSGLSWGMRWEMYSDYAIGVSMVLCALYFVAREDFYIRQNLDGTETIVACDCCPPVSARPRTKQKRRGKDLCQAFDQGKNGDEEALPPPPPPIAHGHGLFDRSYRDVNSAIMGTIQGICCPMTLVGTTFAGFLSTPVRCAVFGFSFLVWSMFGTGALAVMWSRITRTGASWLSPRTVYRSTCVVTLLLGVVWILANATGRLDSLEWTSKIFVQHMDEHQPRTAHHTGK